MSRPVQVGVISDTHGLVRPEVLGALAGVDLIVHAGDVGSPDVLRRLGTLAPVRAVRGNNDHGAWAEGLPVTDVVEVGEAALYVLHDLHALDLDPAAARFDVVIAGHSHRPRAERRGEVLYVNPGSAGPRRFRLPVALVRLCIRGRQVRSELVDLLP